MAHLTVQELSDLCDEMMGRMGLELLPAITKANREDNLDDILASLGMADLLDANDGDDQPYLGKVIVIGASAVKDFQLDYARLKHFDFGKIRGSMGYVAIFAGPMPHKTPGAEEASSFIARVENSPDDYPPLVKLQSGNDLKITNNSFKHAFGQLSPLGLCPGD